MVRASAVHPAPPVLARPSRSKVGGPLLTRPPPTLRYRYPLLATIAPDCASCFCVARLQSVRLRASRRLQGLLQHRSWAHPICLTLRFPVGFELIFSAYNYEVDRTMML